MPPHKRRRLQPLKRTSNNSPTTNCSRSQPIHSYIRHTPSNQTTPQRPVEITLHRTSNTGMRRKHRTRRQTNDQERRNTQARTTGRQRHADAAHPSRIRRREARQFRTAKCKKGRSFLTGLFAEFGRDGVIRTLDPLHPMPVVAPHNSLIFLASSRALAATDVLRYLTIFNVFPQKSLRQHPGPP